EHTHAQRSDAAGAGKLEDVSLRSADSSWHASKRSLSIAKVPDSALSRDVPSANAIAELLVEQDRDFWIYWLITNNIIDQPGVDECVGPQSSSVACLVD